MGKKEQKLGTVSFFLSRFAFCRCKLARDSFTMLGTCVAISTLCHCKEWSDVAIS